jgi:hypothetical protein
MDVYDLTVPQLIHTLGNLTMWLDLAAAHPSAEALLTARLAPDQFTFTRQIQTACDNAKMMAGRLSGKEWPAHPDTETTYPQLKARVAAVVEYLKTFKREDFAGAAEKKITLPWMQGGAHLIGADYLSQFALPNFYFHVVTAYSILRAQGLPMGKQVFIGPINIRS